MTVRVRFAPSPTGYLHLGVARTALFNWIYARSVGGSLILRVEDTDSERTRPEVVQSIVELTDWLGIDFDEGPYFQSERREMHRAAVEQLLKNGDAYLCDKDNNELEGDAIQDGAAIRFRVPDSGEVSFVDEVRGEVSFDKANLEDFVIWRSNGTPTFLLANAVDDAEMSITHAIRGEDLLSSTPKVIMLFEALGKTPPIYGHLPLLVNEARQKLSKRRDDVSLSDWRDKGYMPEAMTNYLSLLGWGPPDDVEIRPMSEIVELFKLSDVGQSPAFFDVRKLDHFNATYIRELDGDEFLQRALSQKDLKEKIASWQDWDEEVFKAIAPQLQSKIRFFSDIENFVDWLFCGDFQKYAYGTAMGNLEALKSAEGWSLDILIKAREAYESVEWIGTDIHQTTKNLAEGMDRSLGKAQMPIRLALTGRKVGLPLFESMVMLPREEILQRLDWAIDYVR